MLALTISRGCAATTYVSNSNGAFTAGEEPSHRQSLESRDKTNNGTCILRLVYSIFHLLYEFMVETTNAELETSGQDSSRHSGEFADITVLGTISLMLCAQ